MTPLVVVRWTRVPGAEDIPALRAFVTRVTADHRDRVVFRWEGPGARILREMVRASREAGFRRIRVERVGEGQGSDRDLMDLVRSGVNEFAFDAGGAPGAEVVAALRARSLLAHVVLVQKVPGEEMRCPLGADELEVRVDGHRLVADPEDIVKRVDALLNGVAGHFRRVSVRGVALCRLASLDPGRVVSNALEVRAPEDVLGLKFADPARVFFGECQACRLSLACDAFRVEEFARLRGPRVRVRPFGGRKGFVQTLDVRGLRGRVHPPSFLTGRVHLFSVAEGIRPAGRVAVSEADLPDQMRLIRDAGLAAEVVEEVPSDEDRARAGEVHVFFARTTGDARRVAEIERSFVRAERGSCPMGPEVFARQMGRALGYPECCIEAFVAAGPKATTEELVRRAHARSEAFHWPLNCLDPRSVFPLIPHIPCRFDCEPSLRMARTVADRLDRLFPGLRGLAEVLLKRPVLMLWPRLAVVLNGAFFADSGWIEYEAVDAIALAPHRGRTREVFDAMVLGIRFQVASGGLVIGFPDGQTRVLRPRVSPLLFPFQ